MDQPLDLFVLSGDGADSALALARRGPDIAIARLDLTPPAIHDFVSFTDRIESAALGTGSRPTQLELDDIGRRMFHYVFRDDVLKLYRRTPAGMVSIQIVTDEQRVQRMPWEFLSPDDRTPVPHQDRCVVRVLPLCVESDPVPGQKLKSIRVLLVGAEPIDEPGVGWGDVEKDLRRNFQSLDGVAVLQVVEGGNRQTLLDNLNSNRFDVFHFLGHGTVIDGEGHLALVDIATQKTDLLSGRDLATALSGQRVKLAILSACETGAGAVDQGFGSVARALLQSGIPAVVANQTSIPTNSIVPFVSALYRRLIRDGNIDSAMMAGRAALQIDLRRGIDANYAVIEWGIPSLYRWPGAAQLFTQEG
ncbi:CHAT domain-containing protein [Burkholderia cepacia]|uniref:CHAT domain-containing protein n=1 Tax=Burkholderia cepacia TaxID=292 RepID=UPI002FDF2F67